jgi:hypothetical protein
VVGAGGEQGVARVYDTDDRAGGIDDGDPRASGVLVDLLDLLHGGVGEDGDHPRARSHDLFHGGVLQLQHPGQHLVLTTDRERCRIHSRSRDGNGSDEPV